MGTPHDRRTLCLSSALADRYEGHDTLESMPSPQNMHDGGRLSIHGRRHASALCALQRRAVAQIAPHIVLRCRPRSLDGVDRSGSHCAPYKSADSGSEAPGFTSYIRTSSVRYICACSCHCLLRAGSRIFTYCATFLTRPSNDKFQAGRHHPYMGEFERVNRFLFDCRMPFLLLVVSHRAPRSR